MDRWLQLTLKNKCDNNACSCSGNKPGGLDSKRETRIESITGFVQYTHKYKEGFKLLPNLGDGESLEGSEVSNVKEVSVFYWDGSYTKPLLLRVIKNSEESTPIYYLRFDGTEEEARPNPKVWKHKNSNGISLQDLLDDRNLGRNNVFPLDLNEPTKRLDTGTNIAKKVEVQLVQTSSLTGTDYRVTEYKLNGKDGNTKFSRAIFDKKKANGIVIPSDPVSQVRLYSSLVSSVPTMVEFVKSGKAGSEWYYSTNSQGTDWQGHAGNTFYGSDRQLTEIIHKLDEFSCKYHKGVTIDLSISMRYGESYCCEEHGKKKGGNGRVSVNEVPVSCTTHHPSSKLIAHKHSISGSGLKLAGIKFYLNSDGSKENRKRVTSSTLKVPADGPIDVYTFYCQGNDPVLVYVYANRSTKSQGSSGWYRKSKRGYDKNWSKISNMPRDITPDTINNCRKWNELIGVLEKLKCDKFNKCSTSSSARSYTDSGEPQDQEEVIVLEDSEEEDPALKDLGPPVPSDEKSGKVSEGKKELAGATGPEGLKNEKDTKESEPKYTAAKVYSEAEEKLWKVIGKAVCGTLGYGLDIAGTLKPVSVSAALGIAGKATDELLSNILSPGHNLPGSSGEGTILVGPEILAATSTQPSSQRQNGDTPPVAQSTVSSSLATGTPGGLQDYPYLQKSQVSYPQLGQLHQLQVPDVPTSQPGGIPEQPIVGNLPSQVSLESSIPTIPMRIGDITVPAGASGELSANRDGAQSRVLGVPNPQAANLPSSRVVTTSSLLALPGAGATLSPPSTPTIPEPTKETLQESISAAREASPDSGTPSGSDMRTISISTSSVLTASGSLTGFGWWIYKRSKGDPWVRQI